MNFYFKVCDICDFSLGKMMVICVSVLFAMVFLCTLFLLVSLVSSGRTSKQIFDSMKKNYCARALNVVVSTHTCTHTLNHAYTHTQTHTHTHTHSQFWLFCCQIVQSSLLSAVRRDLFLAKMMYGLLKIYD